MTSVDLSLERVLAERYQVHGLLGRGGMSDVYRAEDLTGGGQVALKIVRSGDPSLARRLVQEARALEGLDHPGLVRLRDAGTIGDRAYLVMDLVEGPTLVEMLRNGPLSPARAARLGGTVAGALAYVHRAGVVHRDVKPGNVLLDADGTPRLGDFGIALVSDTSTLTAEGTTLGTAAYMAPEQLEDHHVGSEADIWSLGIVLLECLMGRRVYEGAAAEVVAKRLAGPVPLPSDLPTPWRLLLLGMLDHRPDRRLKDEEVEALLSGTAFDRPWVPATVPSADAGGPGRTGSTGAAGTKGTAPTVPVAADLTALDETRVDRTALLPGPPDASARRHRPARRLLAEVVAAALAVGVALALVAVFTGSPARHANGRKAAASSSATTSTTTSSTTTTAPVAPGSAALATLEHDVQAAEGAGTVDPATGSLVTNDASQAVDDAAAGNVVQAGTDLQQAASALAAGVDTGAVSPATGTELAGDLASLASALGVAAPTTATSPPATAPAPAHSGGTRGDHGGRSGNQNS
jgi:eukaryotic-like serine/threonine-protein kinase